jgi:hypothetical protein
LLSRTISSLVAVPHSRRRASRLADRFSEVPCPDPNIDIAIRIRNRYSRTPGARRPIPSELPTLFARPEIANSLFTICSFCVNMCLGGFGGENRRGSR